SGVCPRTLPLIAEKMNTNPRARTRTSHPPCFSISSSVTTQCATGISYVVRRRHSTISQQHFYIPSHFIQNGAEVEKVISLPYSAWTWAGVGNTRLSIRQALHTIIDAESLFLWWVSYFNHFFQEATERIPRKQYRASRHR